MNDINKEAFGIGITAIFESQVFPFMLSSAFTARTIVQEKDDVDGVKTDIWIAVAISLGFSGLMAYVLKSFSTLAFGTAFGFLLLWVYEKRGMLI